MPGSIGNPVLEPFRRLNERRPDTRFHCGMARIRHNDIGGVRPCCRQQGRRRNGANHIVTPLYDDARNALQFRGIVEERTLFQKTVMYEVMRFDPRQTQRFAEVANRR